MMSESDGKRRDLAWKYDTPIEGTNEMTNN